MSGGTFTIESSSYFQSIHRSQKCPFFWKSRVEKFGLQNYYRIPPNHQQQYDILFFILHFSKTLLPCRDNALRLPCRDEDQPKLQAISPLKKPIALWQLTQSEQDPEPFILQVGINLLGLPLKLAWAQSSFKPLSCHIKLATWDCLCPNFIANIHNSLLRSASTRLRDLGKQMLSNIGSTLQAGLSH